MKTLGWCIAGLLFAFIPQCFAGQSASAETSDLDIAPFAKRCCVEDRHVSQVAFDYAEDEHSNLSAERAADGRYIYGLQWAEERDIKEVHVHFRPGGVAEKAQVEYWFHNWPYPAPHMPTTEDPEQESWQGKWLKAATTVDCTGSECRYAFEPLQMSENPLARNAPGVDYRRTLKVRLVFASEPALDRVQVFTGSALKPIEVRVELGAGEQKRYEWNGGLSIYNGLLKSVKLWKGSPEDSAETSHFRISTEGAPKGFLVDLDAAEPSLPGSEDVTIVTLDVGERTFSFAVPDLDKGPIYVPAFHVCVSLASDTRNFSPSIVRTGAKIRERVATEPEQTYERASKEIPELNPVEREIQESDRLYILLAVEASWQKFAFEWGGNIHISKVGAKAKGAELKRLEWMGDRISWRIGTGATPNFRHGWKDSKISTSDGLPIPVATWSNEGISYTEEGFATLLSGPLSPEDAGRSEQTPSVLMLKIATKSAASHPTIGHLWLATDPDERITYDNGELLAVNGQLVRARLKLPPSTRVSQSTIPCEGRLLRGIHLEIPYGPVEQRYIFIFIPFVPRLSADERARLTELNYDTERTRVANYWRQIVATTVPFDIPEEKYMKLAKAMGPHLLISVTKDPRSGLYIVPGASYLYDVFANAGSQDSLVFDLLGDHRRAAEYLETFMRLQGARPMLGTFSGDQGGVYHGSRVDSEYDYTMGEYNLDHGRVLTDLAEHYLYTRDKDWLRHAAPSMTRAADWIVEQRKLVRTQLRT